MKFIIRIIRRLDAVWKKNKAVKTGAPQTMVLGKNGHRRTIHFLPDGQITCHSGSTCICDINWLLESIKDK